MKYLEKYRQEFILNVAKAGNPKGLDEEEIEILSRSWAKGEVAKQKKQLKAYREGKQFYKYYGRTFPVDTEILNDEEE